MRSCSMDLAGITPEYVQRMWGGTVSLEDIEKALAVLKAEYNRSLFWPQWGNKRRRALEEKTCFTAFHILQKVLPLSVY